MSRPLLRQALQLSETRTCVSRCGFLKAIKPRSLSTEAPASSVESISLQNRKYIRYRSTDRPLIRAIKSTSTKTFPETGRTRQRAATKDSKLEANADQEIGPQPNSLSVTVDGTSRLFSPLLLRDICQCHRCIDVSTKQRLFCTSEIPADIQVKSSSADETGISIRWTSDVPGFDADHTTRIPMSSLRSICEDGSTTTWPSPPLRVVWDTALFNADVEDIDYHAYMEDDFALHTAVQQLRTHGLLFLTNVPEDPSSVIKITERIGPVKNTFYGFTWDVRSVPQAKNVAYTSQDLGFHMDLMYMEQPPHIQFLHCIRSSSLGGASLFTDSFKAARDLALTDPTAFEHLCNIPVAFHYDHPESQYYYRRRSTVELPNPLQVHSTLTSKVSYLSRLKKQLGVTEKFPVEKFTERLPVEQVIDAVSWSPPFQAPFSRRSTHPLRLPKRWNLEYSGPPRQDEIAANIAKYNESAAKFNALIHRPEGIYERMMKPGECVLFDNRRVLHARRAFEVGDAGKERWLRGSYMDRDPFMSKLRILQDRFGPLPVKSQPTLHEASIAA